MNKEKLLNINYGFFCKKLAWVYFSDFLLEKAIEDSIRESDLKLSREDFFISSKLWNNYHSKEMVPTAIKGMLTNLGLSYLDLLYIHWPMSLAETKIQDPFPKDEFGNLIFSEIDFIETYKEIEKNLDISNIGLCNFNRVRMLSF